MIEPKNTLFYKGIFRFEANIANNPNKPISNRVFGQSSLILSRIFDVRALALPVGDPTLHKDRTIVVVRDLVACQTKKTLGLTDVHLA